MTKKPRNAAKRTKRASHTKPPTKKPRTPRPKAPAFAVGTVVEWRAKVHAAFGPWQLGEVVQTAKVRTKERTFVRSIPAGTRLYVDEVRLPTFYPGEPLDLVVGPLHSYRAVYLGLAAGNRHRVRRLGTGAPEEVVDVRKLRRGRFEKGDRVEILSQGTWLLATYERWLLVSQAHEVRRLQQHGDFLYTIEGHTAESPRIRLSLRPLVLPAISAGQAVLYKDDAGTVRMAHYVERAGVYHVVRTRSGQVWHVDEVLPLDTPKCHDEVEAQRKIGTWERGVLEGSITRLVRFADGAIRFEGGATAHAHVDRHVLRGPGDYVRLGPDGDLGQITGILYDRSPLFVVRLADGTERNYPSVHLRSARSASEPLSAVRNHDDQVDALAYARDVMTPAEGDVVLAKLNGDEHPRWARYLKQHLGDHPDGNYAIEYPTAYGPVRLRVKKRPIVPPRHPQPGDDIDLRFPKMGPFESPWEPGTYERLAPDPTGRTHHIVRTANGIAVGVGRDDVRLPLLAPGDPVTTNETGQPVVTYVRPVLREGKLTHVVRWGGHEHDVERVWRKHESSKSEAPTQDSPEKERLDSPARTTYLDLAKLVEQAIEVTQRRIAQDKVDMDALRDCLLRLKARIREAEAKRAPEVSLDPDTGEMLVRRWQVVRSTDPQTILGVDMTSKPIREDREP